MQHDLFYSCIWDDLSDHYEVFTLIYMYKTFAFNHSHMTKIKKHAHRNLKENREQE